MSKRRKKTPDPCDTDTHEKIMSLVNEIVRAKQYAKALGVFTNDRELLECTRCNLVEDIAFDGSLMTCRKQDNDFNDTGLRFEDCGDGTFRCPVCGSILKAVML